MGNEGVISNARIKGWLWSWVVVIEVASILSSMGMLGKNRLFLWRGRNEERHG